MSDTSDKPLVTFALFAYNQERFIRDAVAGAIAQDYEPLEIILSDDCSSDQTFKIMTDMAAANTRANVRIILNKNDRNLGLARHVNAVMKLADGEMIVVAAGDDISFPHRVSTIVRAWMLGSKKTDCFCSRYLTIDENGEPMETPSPPRPTDLTAEALAKTGLGFLGATAAWTKALWLDFGPLDDDIIIEDQVIPFWAALRGGVEFIDMPLVSYRKGVSTWIDSRDGGAAKKLRETTLFLENCSLINARAQLAAAKHANRPDLTTDIVRRLDRRRVKYMALSGQTGTIQGIFNMVWHGVGLRETFSVTMIKFDLGVRLLLCSKAILQRPALAPVWGWLGSR